METIGIMRVILGNINGKENGNCRSSKLSPQRKGGGQGMGRGGGRETGAQ